MKDPKNRPRTRDTRLYILSEELYERLRQVAFDLRISHSEIMRRALREYLEKLEKKP